MSDSYQNPTIDGVTFYAMLQNGYRNLSRNMSIIDELNVFPVPDGDTGKNMTRTLLGGISAIETPDKSVGVMMKAFSRGTLMSARGNSGVISSQIIRGLKDGCLGHDTLDIDEFLDILEAGVKRSYASVPNAVEGTILTVMREATEYAKAHRSDMTDHISCLRIVLTGMKESLAHTPELLPVLKNAGVVDSGGAGLVCIFEGMLMELEGKTLTDADGMSLDAADFHIHEDRPVREHVRYATIAVANGPGIADYFTNAGIDLIIDGGQTQNPAASDFLRAFRELNADYIIVFPSNSNIIMTAEQAAEMYHEADVRVIHTHSIAETYSSLSLMDPDIPTIEQLVEELTYYLPNVTTGYVTTATRDTIMNGIQVTEGHYIGLTSDTIYSDSTDKLEAAKSLLLAIPSISDKEAITIFYGADVSEEEAGELIALINGIDPMIDVGTVNGGQEVYSFIMAIE